MPAYASSAKIASAEAKLGGPIALDSSILLRQLVVALGNVTGGGGGGSGTVTSVSVTTQNGVSATVTNPTTTPALAFTLGAITPTTVQLSGSVSGTTLLQSPAVAGSAVITFPSVTGTLAIIGNPLSQFASTTSAQLAGVISDETGSGSLVFATSPTLVTPVLGTPTSGTLSNCTGLPISTGVSGLGTGVATTLATNLSITGGGTIALGGFTLTVPATGTAALLGVANVFTRGQSITQGTANESILTSTGFSVTGSNTTSMVSLSGTVNTSAVVNLLDFSFTTTAFGTGTNLLRIRAGGAGTTDVFSINDAGGIWRLLAPATYISANNCNIGVFITGINVNKDWFYGWSSTTFGYDSADLILRRKAAATLQMGTDAAGVTNQMFTAASRITSDGVGANLTIAAGNGRGAAGGTLIFSTYTTAGAATIGTLTTRMTIDTAGAIAFPNVTAVVTETVVSDRTLAVSINGTAYKICLKS